MPWRLNFKQASVENLEAQLRGTIDEAWARCVPIWLNSSWNDESYAHGGRVNDYPFGLHHPRYVPSEETRLGHLFIERFAEEYPFFLDRYAHGSPGERLCAFDLLLFLAYELYYAGAPLPIELRESELLLPEVIRADLEWEPEFMDALHTFTLGDVLVQVPPLM